MVQEFEDLFVGAVFGLPGAYFGGGGFDAAVDVAFGFCGFYKLPLALASGWV